ncbi:MAG: hypothetical protein WEG56_02680 [Chloroflexota bacterium]
MKTRFNLPKDGLVEPEGRVPSRIDGDGEDVEGHGLPITAPPSLGAHRSPGHGGENTPSLIEDDNDVEGHLRR